MSPERTSPNGQYRTNWKRKEIGRIRVTWGYTEKEHIRAVHLLDDLYVNGQWDVLRALKKKKGEPGRIEIGELLAAKKAGRHRRDDVLVDLRLQRPLWTTLEEEAGKRPGGDKHRRRVLDSIRKFARSPEAAKLKKSAVVADLARVDYVALRPHFASAADWNHFRKAIGSTLAALLEDARHVFRLGVMKKIAHEHEPRHDVDISVDQFWALVDRLPEHARPGIMTLAITGMRLNTEYRRCTAADKRPEIHGVYCPGSKTADAAGIIPVAESLWEWVDAGIPAPIQERWLRKYFHRAALETGLGQLIETGKTRRVRIRRDRSGPPALGEPTGPQFEERPVRRYKGITLHDLRHLALQLAMDGGAQLNDVQALARHADPAMTMRYLKRAGARRSADAIGKQLKRTKEA